MRCLACDIIDKLLRQPVSYFLSDFFDSDFTGSDDNASDNDDQRLAQQDAVNGYILGNF